MTLIRTINTDNDNRDNIGSGYAIYLLPVSNIAQFPELVNGKYLESVQLVSGEAWVMVKFSPDTLSINKKNTRSKNLRQFSHTIQGRIPRDNMETTNTLLAFDKEDKFICVFEYTNGEKILLGTPDHPLQITFDSDSGEQVASLNHYLMQIKWSNSYPAPAYEEDIWSKSCDPVEIYIDGVYYGTFAPGTRVDIKVGNVFNLEYTYEDPSGIHVLKDFYRSYTFTRDAEIVGIGVQSAGITNIRYSKDDITYQDLTGFTIPFANGETLYLQTTNQSGSTSGYFTVYGNYTD